MASSHERNLRANATAAERILRQYLRAYRLRDHKSRRQVPIGRYIVNFVCFEARIIIELDGGQYAERTGYERESTIWLRGKGFRALRFWNTEMLHNLQAARDVIAQACATPPSP